MRSLAFLLVLSVAGCGGHIFHTTVPAPLPDGKRGFSSNGTAQHTSSVELTKTNIEATFREACRGDIRFVSLELMPYRNPFGVPFVEYNAIAECL